MLWTSDYSKDRRTSLYTIAIQHGEARLKWTPKIEEDVLNLSKVNKKDTRMLSGDVMMLLLLYWKKFGFNIERIWANYSTSIPPEIIKKHEFPTISGGIEVN